MIKIITENRKNYLNSIVADLKSKLLNTKILLGRYSVLSEVGMVPAELMGLNTQEFKNINELIKSKNFTKSLVDSVEEQ